MNLLKMFKYIQRINIQYIIVLGSIFLIKLPLAFFLSHSLDPLGRVQYVPQKLFLFDLLGIPIPMSWELVLVLDLLNVFLLWVISYFVFKEKYSFVPPFLYAISPWSTYLAVMGSFYVYLLFLILLFVSVAVVNGNNRSRFAVISMIIIALVMVISSWMMFFILPVLILFLHRMRLIAFNKIHLGFMTLLLILCITLFSANKVGFRNILSNDIGLYDDPGIINTVNEYRGSSKNEGFVYLSKLLENRYFYKLKYITLKTLEHLSPSTYFTAEEKLLGFSFSPPIYFGLIIPFVLGIYGIYKSRIDTLFLFLPLVLIIPSLLSKNIVDLNRLVLIEPVLVAIISMGMIEIYTRKKEMLFKYLLLVTLILTISQIIITTSDILMREHSRYELFYDKHLELGRQ